jgi:hypothetical protein
MNSKYSITFISRGLLVQQSLDITDLYLKLHDWQKVRQQTLASNLLQTKTLPTAKNLSTEIISRLKKLTENELILLGSASKDEQCYLLWMAVCKRYKLLFELAVEVLHEKYLRADLILTYEDYDHFFNTKAEWHEELSRLNTESEKKLRRTIFQMMREAQLITKQNKIRPVLLSNRFLQTVFEQSREYLQIFPFSEFEARALSR